MSIKLHCYLHLINEKTEFLLAQGHKVSKQWCWGMNPGFNSRPDFVLPTTKATDFSLSYSSCPLWDIDCCDKMKEGLLNEEEIGKDTVI